MLWNGCAELFSSGFSKRSYSCRSLATAPELVIVKELESRLYLFWVSWFWK